MRYKVGDKVEIKTWYEMKKEFGLKENLPIINCRPSFNSMMEDDINKNYSRVSTIKEIFKINNSIINYYYMKEIGWTWGDDMIKHKVKKKIFNPIYSRFEILDL